jgi:hypothetical protein
MWSTSFTGTAWRGASKAMLKRNQRRKRGTMAAIGRHDTQDIVATCRIMGITPHHGQKRKGSANDGLATRHMSYKASQQQRKRLGKVFGWLKTVAHLAGQMLLATTTYNLIRTGTIGDR